MREVTGRISAAWHVLRGWSVIRGASVSDGAVDLARRKLHVSGPETCLDHDIIYAPGKLVTAGPGRLSGCTEKEMPPDRRQERGRMSA